MPARLPPRVPRRARIVTVEAVAPGAKVPYRATDGSAAFDLASRVRVALRHGIVTKVPTGLKLRAPVGTFLEVRPRSGLASRGVLMMNAPGTIDRDYSGEVFVPLTYLFRGRYWIEAGDRIAQVRVVPDEPTAFRRGTVAPMRSRSGGFGSTGR